VSAAIRDARSRFAAHPGHLLVLRSFLFDPFAQRLGWFLTEEAHFRPAYGLYSRPGEATKDEWLRSHDGDRLYRHEILYRFDPRLSDSTIAYVRFRAALEDPRFLGYFAALTSIELASIHIHVHSSRHGDFIRPHDDEMNGRRLAFVLYLSPEWSTELGGALQVVDASGAAVEVEAEFNTLVVFDLRDHQHHSISPIVAAAGSRRRVSIGGWLHGVDSCPVVSKEAGGR
jgi:Rps23 Pro-64 3,4-dihydroxylase Tpa1-like proline 4-hydroxylase